MNFTAKEIRDILNQPHVADCDSHGWGESVKMDFCDCFLFDANHYFTEEED